MRKLIVYCIILLSSNINAQKTLNPLEFSIRLPIQIDFQEEEITYGPNRIEKGKQINFGLEALIEKKVSIFTVNIGAGLFKNTFNISRPYDHVLLNFGRDSLTILTKTDPYSYFLLRVPAGFSINFYADNKKQISVGVDHYFNYAFLQDYGNNKPFEGAKRTYSGFSYYGNTLNGFVSWKQFMKGNRSFELIPFIRIFNNYREDRFLFEDEKVINRKMFDAFGFSLKYNLPLTLHKP